MQIQIHPKGWIYSCGINGLIFFTAPLLQFLSKTATVHLWARWTWSCITWVRSWLFHTLIVWCFWMLRFIYLSIYHFSHCPQILWKDQNKQWIIHFIITCVHVMSGGWLETEIHKQAVEVRKCSETVLQAVFVFWREFIDRKQVDYWFKCYQRTETFHSFQKLTPFLFLSPLTFSHTGFNI